MIHTFLVTSLGFLREFVEVALVGFFIAGLINAAINKEAVARRLGRNIVWANALASVWGFLTPLCCCSGVPTAMSLYRFSNRRTDMRLSHFSPVVQLVWADCPGRLSRLGPCAYRLAVCGHSGVHSGFGNRHHRRSFSHHADKWITFLLRSWGSLSHCQCAPCGFLESG